ncbi:MAG: DUF262 domain-containing protein [Acholeplasmataceae bacterium]|jgi:uncharacterized protein with ParB-like and HNH nuclease domain
MNNLLSLSELFNNKIFRIPDYQRGYAWDREQLEDFWEDLENLTMNRNHYFGMFSLKEVKEDVYNKWEEERWIITDKRYKPYHVVDGQQRLTTFVIFVSCILNLAKSKKIGYLNGVELERIKEKYIIEHKLPGRIAKAYKFGYEKDNPSFNYLRYKILGEEAPSESVETFYTNNLKEAKNYFDQQLERFYYEKGEVELEKLFIKVINNLQFNIHFIDDDFDVFVAFETMNNRGKKLSNLEILKNRLIYLTTIYDDSILDIDSKNQLRKDINEAWKEVYYQLGRKNSSKPLNDDAYLRNHWTLFFKYSRNRGDDYIKFLLGQHFTPKAVFGKVREVILDEPIEDDYDDDIEEKIEKVVAFEGMLDPQRDIKEYVSSLKLVSKYWYYSYNPSESGDIMNDEEKKWVDKLNRIGINYFRTLVVASLVNKSITSEQRIRLFKVIEKTIFVFFRMAQYRSNWRSSETYNRARELMKGEVDIEDVILELDTNFERNKDEAVLSFISKITSLFKNNDGYYSWNSRWYFLFEYEMELAKKTLVQKITNWSAFTKNPKDHISIEHIYPQQANRFYWRNQFRDYHDEEKKILTNSLGNLLALSQSVNSSLQNDEYYDKRDGNNRRERGYKNGSNSEIEVALNYPDWTPDAIKKRGLHLLSFMEKRWDFKFANEDDKLKALGLEFMKEERVTSQEIDEVIIHLRSQEMIDYLDNYQEGVVRLYTSLFSLLVKEIPKIKEKAVLDYIAIKNANDQNICEIKLYKRQHRIKINIFEPQDEELRKIGEYEKDPNYVHKFYINLKTEEDINQAVEAIIDSYHQM